MAGTIARRGAGTGAARGSRRGVMGPDGRTAAGAKAVAETTRLDVGGTEAIAGAAILELEGVAA